VAHDTPHRCAAAGQEGYRDKFTRRRGAVGVDFNFGDFPRQAVERGKAQIARLARARHLSRTGPVDNGAVVGARARVADQIGEVLIEYAEREGQRRLALAQAKLERLGEVVDVFAVEARKNAHAVDAKNAA
jgi:hypothetical protein